MAGEGTPSTTGPAGAPPVNGASPATAAPRGNGARWLRAPARALGVAALVVVLAWAWSASGLSGAGSLWENRERAGEYLFGKPVSAESLDARRAEAERQFRQRVQAEAAREIEAQAAAAGEAAPSSLQLLERAGAEARRRMDAMGPEKVRGAVDAMLDQQGLAGGRQGGYFPPETDPRAVFGDPASLSHVKAPLSWAVSWADRQPDGVRRATRWVVSAIAGEGYTGELLETVAISIWGTLLALFASLPAALLASDRSLRLLLPGDGVGDRGLRHASRWCMRRLFDLCRGLNEIVLAMIFVAVLGLGPLPGVIALAVHTFGVLGKVLADALDAMDPRPVEGVLSTGAAPTQVIAWAVIPQLLPQIASQGLLRFESNIRGATVLGVVGAGGIGQLLMDKFDAFQFREVTTMVIIIVVVVTLTDSLCGWVMRRVV